MLLTLSTTHRPATDLGFLLHKNPARAQSLDLAFGQAQMFYPEASEERCTFALLLDLNPIDLVRGSEKGGSGLFDQYVNDRAYAASSFLSVAIARCLRTALGGRCDQLPKLAAQAIPLEAMVSPLPVRGEVDLIRRLFAPLGYEIEVVSIPLDEAHPDWGSSPYVTLRLKATCRLADLLGHLYVLIPVLDLKKHYFIQGEEIDKLIEKGGEWLRAHPDRALIARRYLRRRRSLANEAIARLAEADGATAGLADLDEPEIEAATDAVADPDAVPEEAKNIAEEALEKPLRLHEQRLRAVTEVLKASGAQRVADLGCGSGKLLKRLMAERQFTEILGLDISLADLERAAKRLRLERLDERQRARITLAQGALTYRDRRIEGFDAAALVEVIEHIDMDRLESVERVVFACAKPQMVVVTTPNREYNAKFEGMKPGEMRHADHRFEWTRAEFAAWAGHVAERFGYGVSIEPLGEVDAERPVTRMLNSAWMKARKRAGLEQVRVHDLKHTFGRRLRAAGVSFEDRQDLLGHRSCRVTMHYSAVELVKLIEAANRVCDGDNRQPELVVLRGAFRRQSPQIPHIPPRERYSSPVKSLKTLVAEEGLEPPTRGL
jgi:3' terminal RNA ribose 2'-O-methyltransferase Hen1